MFKFLFLWLSMGVVVCVYWFSEKSCVVIVIFWWKWYVYVVGLCWVRGCEVRVSCVLKWWLGCSCIILGCLVFWDVIVIEIWCVIYVYVFGFLVVIFC